MLEDKEDVQIWHDIVFHQGALKFTGRWSSKKWKKTFISADWRDSAKLSGLSVSTLLGQIISQPVKN